jgi:uncharacterized membrane protein YhaH (DUF805 family)
MGNLLFSPSGRIGPGQFMSGYTVVIVASLVLGLLPIFVPALAMLSILGLVLFWCTIVLWIKRYHDGGKTGWMCLIPIIVTAVIGGIASTVLAGMFVDPDAAAALAEAAEAGDFGALFGAAGKGGMTTMGAIIVNVVGAVISYVIAMVFNNMIKHDAHDNQYGPEAGTS